MNLPGCLSVLWDAGWGWGPGADCSSVLQYEEVADKDDLMGVEDTAKKDILLPQGTGQEAGRCRVGGGAASPWCSP